jgi:hypothetical protein
MAAEAAGDEDVGMELGDSVLILGGRLNKTVGKLYGLSEDRFTIQRIGESNTVTHIPLIDGAPDPSYGIQEIKILKKVTKPGFVNLVDMRAGQYVEAFNASGEPAGVFQVIRVDEENDTCILLDENNEEIPIDFSFSGIPRDLEFEVIRTRESPVEEAPKKPEQEGVGEEAEASPGSVEDEDLIAGEGVGEEGAEEGAEGQGEGEEPAANFVIGEEVELSSLEEIKEKTSAEQIFPDEYQRSELLAQLIRLLPEYQQRDPVKLQEVRRTVEVFMHMRNKVVLYGKTGEPRGSKPTSITTLSELVGRPNIPLTRKVVPMKKVVYTQHTLIEEGDKIVPKAELDSAPGDLLNEDGEKTGLYVKYQPDIIDQANELDELAGMDSGEALIGNMPKTFLDLEKYRTQIQTPYIVTPGKGILTHDEEVFRSEIPDVDDNPVSALDGKLLSNPPPPTHQIGFSITRLLKDRITRFTSGERERIVESGESYTYDNTLVFPLSVLRDLGPIRSGYLVKDVSLGMTTPTLMKDILNKISIDEFPSADNILNLGIKGNILGNVTVRDWLDQQNIVLNGIGDVQSLLHGYGVKDLEWNKEQAALIADKIESHLAGLRIFMTKQREENSSYLANLKFTPQPLLSDADSSLLLGVIEGEPILQKVLEEIREYMGELANIDINWFTYVFLKYPDFVVSVLGKQPGIVAKQRMINVREQFMAALHQGYRLKLKNKNVGEVPKKNPCEHVNALEDVRKVGAKADEPRDMTKMKLLLALLNKYRGETKDNWVHCNVCQEHLICAHELLQIQEFIRPKEQEVLHKELLLKFSGGAFGGKFICRVCGQAISEMEFDTHLEFDDEGRPMMGRSEMVDLDAIAEEKIQDILAGPAEVVDEINFGSDELNTMYKTLKTIAGLVGISPEEEDYMKMIELFSDYNNTLPTREEYVKKTSGKKAQDYDVFYSLRYVSAAAAIILINVQIHTPDYVIYYTNSECRNGLFGYPLEEPSNLTGLNCVASVIAGINEKEFPWNMTTLQKSSDYIKRTNFILPFVRGQVDEFAKNPIIQNALQKKREYQKSVYGAAGTKKVDLIPGGFRPIPYKISEEEAAEEAIVAAAASPEKKAKAWIQAGHALAKKNAPLNPDTPFTETTCCLHGLAAPQEFWASKSSVLPELESRAAGNPLYRSGTASTTFFTVKPELIEGKLKSEDYFTLFLKVCYEGNRKGLPHELGLGDKPSCLNCGLNFLQNPDLPILPELNEPSSEYKGEKERGKELSESITKAQTAIKEHISSQGVEITEESFYDLLQTSQQKNYITKDPLPVIPRAENTFTRLSEVKYFPLEGWDELLRKIQASMIELGAAPSVPEIATAAEDLVANLTEKEAFIRNRVGAEAFRVLENITRRSARECGDTITTYILTPFQRLLAGVQRSSFKILKSYELSPETIEDITSRGLNVHLEPLLNGQELNGLLLRKVKHLVNELSESCKIVFPLLRPLTTPGGMIMVTYILRSFLMGPIYRYLDPHFIPPMYDQEDDGSGDKMNIKLLYQALTQALTKFNRGSNVPSEQEIRIQLEQRQEAENQKFLKRLDKMTKERRQVELTLKKFGMGEWAVGGTKAIRQYDPERYENERVERAQAGLTDYFEPQREEGRAYDMFGYVAEGAGDADGGYDHDQMREEDY